MRENRDGEMVLSTYGRSTGFCIDPIEKKPLNQFYPGTSVLSFGTAGCNLGCKFCQNWSISKSREIERLSENASPEAIAQAALKLGCRSVAFTYNDPGDLGRVCDRHGQGLPRGGRQNGRRHRRLHHAAGPAGVLRVHGRGQCRSEGIHRGLLSSI